MAQNEKQNQNQQTILTEQNSEESQMQNQDGQESTENQNQNQPNNVQNEFDAARDSNRDVINLYDQVLREKEDELRRLREQVAERNKPEPLSADEQKQRFFSNPMDVLREEISNAVKPLMEFTSSFKQQSEYSRLKDRYRNDPRYAQIFPRIEGYVDQILVNSEKNEQTLKTAVLVAIGALQTGEIKDTSHNQNQNQTRQTSGNVQQNQSPQNQPNNMTVPAHLRSTPPGMPQNNNQNQKPVLTELEKRLARERGMSEEDWARFRDMPAHEVATVEAK